MENAWRIPVRTVLTLAGPWDKVSVTVSPWTPCPRPESQDAGEDPEPIDDLGLCCEKKRDVKQAFLLINIYSEDVKRKAGFLLDKTVQYSKGKSVNLYAVRQLAKDMKQYADEAWRIADQLIKDKE